LVDIALVSGTPHLPQLVGGVEVNTHELAGELVRRGHRVLVLAKLGVRNFFGLRRLPRVALGRAKFVCDRELGYPVFRSRRLPEAMAALPRPNVAVVQNGAMVELAAAFDRLGVPSVAYLHGFGFQYWDAGSTALPFRGYIANSQYTAAMFREIHGIEPVVVPPLFRRERYQTAVVGREVTFVNPVAGKGVGVALAVAERCPEIRFGFLLAWPLGFIEQAGLWARLRRLPNVQLYPRTFDMREVYRNTRILLAPSQEAEGWGRVASEAQFSGIPVIASSRGGLPEAVGEGGLVVGVDEPAETWAAALRALWHDEALYHAKSEAALRHSRRPQLDPDAQIETILATLQRASQ
jgi:glycosyltransferase involved in cell wall biosynthesis